MTSGSFIYTYILPLLPSALTVGGWYFVYWRENKKRINERKYQRIDSLIRLISEIETSSIRYYCSPADSTESLGQEIIFNLKRLNKICGKISPKIDITPFRIVTTGGNFQSKQRQPLAAHATLIYQIRQEALDLSLQLDKHYD